MAKGKRPRGESGERGRDSEAAEVSATSTDGSLASTTIPSLRRSFVAHGGPVELYVVDDAVMLLRTPFDPLFLDELKRSVPNRSLEYRVIPKEWDLHFKKGWFILRSSYWAKVEALVERCYGVGSIDGAFRWLGVTREAAPAVIATAYFCRRTEPDRDEVQDSYLEEAIRTLEREGYRLAPPYGPGGVSETEVSLLDLPPTPFELPPRTRVSAELAMTAVKKALTFKAEFDQALHALVAGVPPPPSGDVPQCCRESYGRVGAGIGCGRQRLRYSSRVML